MMNTPIVECIPNFSDARRPEVVEAIRDAIASVSGVHVLDIHSDLDHNRSVITFAGSPAGVEEAAWQGIRTAAGLIDLDFHHGEHPRIGATDVVPFVPISGISMGECIEMAHRLGKRVAEELAIPVYFYEEAAIRPDRKNLENLRRGQFEGLKKEIETNPDRQPDYGPARLGSAGATVIGARHPLIAYNVYLTTDDVSIAKKIAKAVRYSTGGMRYVKALGLLVDGRAQVSMNLTNYKETPVARVVEAVRREAQRYGVGVHHSELVGLIPEDALIDAAVWYTQLDQFEPEQVLERRLNAALAQGSPQCNRLGFLEELAANTPTPGGGSASAYSGAAAAALVAMVARLTLGKKKYADVEAIMQQILEQTEGLRLELMTAVDQDADAYNAVMAACKLPKSSAEEQLARASTVESATLHAAAVPLDVARRSWQIMQLALQVIQQGNLNAISDAGTAVAQARAAITGAGYNVRINIASLTNPGAGQKMLDSLRQIERSAVELEVQARQLLRERGGLPLD